MFRHTNYAGSAVLGAQVGNYEPPDAWRDRDPSTVAMVNRQRKTDKLTKVSGKSAASRQPSKRAINSSNLYKLRKFEYLPRVLTFYMAIQTCTYLYILTSWQHCCHSLAVEDNKIMKKLVGLCVWKEVSESTDKAGSCIVYWRRR